MPRKDGISAVLEAFENSNWDEIHLVTDEVEIHLSAHSQVPDPGVPRLATPPQTSHASGTEVGPLEEPSALLEGESGELVDDGFVDVVASTPGIFWRSPSPGAAPFVEVGTSVSVGDTMCIVEVMKLMGTITAPVEGVVVQVRGTNGEPVAGGDVLFRVRPTGNEQP